MPTFSFTAKSKRTKTTRKYVPKSDSYVEGIVWIDIQGNYYLLTSDGTSYNFTDDSYSCKGYTEIYVKRIEKKNRLIYVRSVDHTDELNNRLYSPFGVGCLVKALKINGATVKFQKIINRYVDGLSGDAINYFRHNYKEIKKCLKVQLK